jgi:hypothetical protein
VTLLEDGHESGNQRGVGLVIVRTRRVGRVRHRSATNQWT